MLYCEKCHSVCQDSTSRCPNCKRGKLRPVREEDMVRLHRVDQYTAGLLEQRCAKEGVALRTEPFSGGWVSYLYDNDVLPTDKLVLAPWGDYQRAEELTAQVEEEVRQERAQVPQEGEEEFQDMPLKKRLLVQALSVFAFLVLVMLVVFGADAAANWVKGLFR